MHQLTAARHQPHCILEPKHARQCRRHVFADAMADQCLRLQTQRQPVAGQRVFDTKQCRLGNRGRRQGSSVGRKYFFPEVKIDHPFKRAQTGIECFLEDRFAGIKRRAHRGILCALAGKH